MESLDSCSTLLALGEVLDYVKGKLEDAGDGRETERITPQKMCRTASNNGDRQKEPLHPTTSNDIFKYLKDNITVFRIANRALQESFIASYSSFPLLQAMDISNVVYLKSLRHHTRQPSHLHQVLSPMLGMRPFRSRVLNSVVLCGGLLQKAAWWCPRKEQKIQELDGMRSNSHDVFDTFRYLSTARACAGTATASAH
jgi:hypothetical protein